MAKNDNLKDFLTDVADAIRQKKGTSALINPQDFSAEIASIQSGGGGLEEKDVNFYECDGTLLYSYTKEEALALTEMPAIPEYIGPDGQPMENNGWNFTLEEMQNQVSNIGVADIGVQRVVEDSLFVMNFKTKGAHRVSFRFLAGDFSVTFDWGDGLSTTHRGSSDANLTCKHDYGEDTLEKVVIRMRVNSGTPKLGYSTTDSEGSTTNSPCIYYGQNALEEVYLSSGVGTNNKAFADCYNLKVAVIPNNASQTIFSKCFSLKAFICQSACLSIEGSAFNNCINLKIISLRPYISLFMASLTGTGFNRLIIPTGCNLMGVQAVAASLTKALFIDEGIVIPTAASSCFAYTHNVREIIMPTTYTGAASPLMGTYLFAYSPMLQKVIFKGDLKALPNYSFYLCGELEVVDLRNCTSVPSVGVQTFLINSFKSSFRIVVDDDLVENFKKATNWVTWSGYIIGATEYDASLNS